MDVPEPDTDAATHGVVTNMSCDAVTRATWIRAENAVVSACLEHGQSAFLTVDEDVLDAYAPESLAAIRSLDRLTDPGEDTAVFRAGEDDRQTVRAALSIDDASEAIPVHQVVSWRAHGIERITTLGDGSWRYDSVPEQASSRWVHEPSPALLSAIESALAPVPATGLFPTGAITAQTPGRGAAAVGAKQIELYPDQDLIQELYHFSDLETVLVDTRSEEVVLDWRTYRSRANSSLGRVVFGTLHRLRESPPTRLCPDDTAQFERLRDVFSTMAAELAFGVEYREL
ncbi:hypothetical protein ACFQL1_03130 [Halomicroarcula sp. GCM10025709]|uniref:hypothetical protein n=1 Tax=Haloarcula TaxID=2237 RepID=UPI0024C2391E|nr:hypothetical protein [Halomicroarcula sp. YJ-61-S]